MHAHRVQTYHVSDILTMKQHLFFTYHIPILQANLIKLSREKN